MYWTLRRFFFNKIMGSRLTHRLVGNPAMQSFLEKNIKASRFLMGIGWGSYIGTSGEKEVLYTLADDCGGIECIFDVGANKGQFLSHLLEVVSESQVSVHCFEPTTPAFEELKAQFPECEYPAVTKNRIALGREPGRKHIFYDQPGSGSASMHMKMAENAEHVEVTTIDRYCVEAGIEHVDLLKIDVEGHELPVLLGAQEMFESGNVDAAMFEFGPHHIPTGTMLHDFYTFFSDHGMHLFRITPSGYLHPLDEYKEVMEQFGVTNYLAVSDPSQVESSVT